MAVFLLDSNCPMFPDPHLGEEDGLLAVGGKLTPEWLSLAYSKGIFPWYSFRYAEDILWYCPMDRFVIFPGRIHISHSMRNLFNKGTYSFTIGKDFDSVIGGCSVTDGRNKEMGAWLGDDMIKAYKRMHELGKAQSVEVWEEGKLAGGLYGIILGKTFVGESMFSLRPSASKAALIFLAKTMLEKGGNMIDCQFETAHLLTMGGEHIPYERYMEIVRSGMEK